MPKHQNKHIREAIEYAEDHGWRFVKAGPRAHSYGTLYCPHAGGCIEFVRSTPRNPEGHARYLRKKVDQCPHQSE